MPKSPVSGRPHVAIDLGAIEANAAAVVAMCARHGIRVVGVTKAVAGLPEVARAMLRGGVAGIGESRLRNVERLRRGRVDAELCLLRIPSLSDADAIVECFQISLNSELDVLAALSEASLRRGTVHDVIVMVDLGDLREGLWPDELPGFVRAAAKLPGVRILGLGTNLSCYAGVVPSAENMGRLVAYAGEAERMLGHGLTRISGGSSSALPLVAAGAMPERVDELRVGEAILLGTETVHRRPLAGTRQDAFTLHAEVIELKRKPSVPIGERAEDAFGARPAFEDRGLVDHAIVNVGRADVDLESLQPADPRLSILGASSDHLILDASGARGDLRLGDRVAFSLGYGSLLAAMTSPYVDARFVSCGAGAVSGS